MRSLGLLSICAAIGAVALGAPAVNAQDYRAYGQTPGPIWTPEPDLEPEVKTSWDSDDMRAALVGQPIMTQRIVYCECSNRKGINAIYNPNVIVYRSDGSPLYYGCAQLMTGTGNGYTIFQSWGYTNWRDPEQVVSFINQVQDRGMLISQYPNTRLGCQDSP